VRHDHTKWVTHFVRDRLPERDFPGTSEHEYGHFVGGELGPDADAFDVLRTIIRLGGLTPGYSFRNGRTTIYGGLPAVCATEMPLYSFAQYVRDRKNTANVSAYGISFLKSEFHAAGGRPVIYGLSNNSPHFTRNTATERVFDESVLPLSEQYRYVAYNPSNSSKWVDWSHEREWRWIAQDNDLDEIWVQDYEGYQGSIPALPLFKGQLDGRPFTKLCVIVWTNEEAEEIRHLLTGFYLAGANNYGTPFDKKLIEQSKIVVLQDVVDAVEKGGKLKSKSIEGLDEAKLLKAIDIVATLENAEAIVRKAMSRAGIAAKAAVDAFASTHGSGSAFCGYANATTLAVTDPLVQYLLRTDRASGPFDGRVWLEFPRNYEFSQSMDYNEVACVAACEALSAELLVTAYGVDRAMQHAETTDLSVAVVGKSLCTADRNFIFHQLSKRKIPTMTNDAVNDREEGLFMNTSLKKDGISAQLIEVILGQPTLFPSSAAFDVLS
jgi:hypothetical protein